MPLSWKDQRLCLALCAVASIASCSTQSQLDSAASEEPPKVDGKKRRTAPRDASADDALDAGAQDAETRVSTREKKLDKNVDAGDSSEAESEPEPPKKPAKKASEPDTSKKQEKSAPDAGEAPDKLPDDADKKTDEPKMDAECSRPWLRDRADAYVKSLASGDTMALRLHPSFRYTENGRDEQLGAGAWLRRGESQFTRHVLDETSCSTLTQAVMSGLTGRFSFAVRLRYTEGQLLEAESQVVPELLASTDLDSIIPKGDDPFVTEVPKDKRMSREALFAFAQRYFDSVTGVSSLPPSAPECRRLQNGVPLGDGTCTRPPGTARFEQQRFDLADEPNGILSATVLYENHIGVYLLKIAGDKLQTIEVIGGATSPATGW